MINEIELIRELRSILFKQQSIHYMCKMFAREFNDKPDYETLYLNLYKEIEQLVGGE